MSSVFSFVVLTDPRIVEIEDGGVESDPFVTDVVGRIAQGLFRTIVATTERNAAKVRSSIPRSKRILRLSF